MGQSKLSSSEFEDLALEALERLFDQIEDQLGDDFDVDLENDILSIDLEEAGIFLLNKHAPNQQLWLSSPKSGAWHFDYGIHNVWICTKSEKSLTDCLNEELSQITKQSIHVSL